ncbi:hypothetical protein K439DRAFT_1612577 [Ramaria rubella]|nr:hypothetical protein K439DRAFT_1612577 [Ramaria rubella]
MSNKEIVPTSRARALEIMWSKGLGTYFDFAFIIHTIACGLRLPCMVPPLYTPALLEAWVNSQDPLPMAAIIVGEQASCLTYHMCMNNDALPGAGHPSFLINGTHHHRAYEDLMGDLETSTRALERLCDVFHLGLTVNPDVNPVEWVTPTSVQIEVRVPQQCRSDACMAGTIEHIWQIFVQEITIPAILFRNNRRMNVMPGHGVAATPHGTVEVQVGGSNAHRQSLAASQGTSPSHGTPKSPTPPTSPSPYPITPPSHIHQPMLYTTAQTPLSQLLWTGPDSPSPAPGPGAARRCNSSAELWTAIGDIPGMSSTGDACPSLPPDSFESPTPPPPSLTLPLSLTPFMPSPSPSASRVLCQVEIDPPLISLLCHLFSRASFLSRQAYTAPDELMLGSEL